MGTNYYWHDREPCSHCKRPYEGLHIGKSSAGWVFALHVYTEPWREDSPLNLLDWLERFDRPGSVITDEYGSDIPVEKMLKIITERGTREGAWTEESLRENHAVRGPNGLARACIDGRHVIGHGAGTWDLHIGDFQ